MKKKYIIVALMLVAITLCGCTRIARRKQREIKKEEEKIYNVGIKYIKNHIRNKYWFELDDSEIMKVTYGSNCGTLFGCDGYDGSMTISAVHNAISFKAKYNGSDYVVDTYEKDLLKDRVKFDVAYYLNIDVDDFKFDMAPKAFGITDDYYLNVSVAKASYSDIIDSSIVVITTEELNRNSFNPIFEKMPFVENVKYIQTYTSSEYDYFTEEFGYCSGNYGARAKTCTTYYRQLDY